MDTENAREKSGAGVEGAVVGHVSDVGGVTAFCTEAGIDGARDVDDEALDSTTVVVCN